MRRLTMLVTCAVVTVATLVFAQAANGYPSPNKLKDSAPQLRRADG